MADKFIFLDTNGDFDQEGFISVSAGSADAGKAVKTNANGIIDASFIDFSTVSLLDGSQDYTGIVNYTSTITVDQFTSPYSLVDKAYVDAIAQGLKPHGNVKAASATYLANNSTISGSVAYDNNLTITATLATSGSFVIDGYSTSAGDRILIRNEGDTGGLGAIANGVYDVAISGTSLTLTRSSDLDNSPSYEVVNGVLIPRVENGTANQGSSYIIVSNGTGTNGEHVFGTDNIIFDIFQTQSNLVAGDGITFIGNAVTIDWASVYTIDSADAKAIKASVLASTTNGQGASIIGIEDVNNYYTSNNVEGALTEVYELANKADQGIKKYTAAAAITAGDVVYPSANDSVTTYSDITQAQYPIGIALSTVSSGQLVDVISPGNDITISGASFTAGDKYYWSGSSYTNTWSGLSNGGYIWVAGVAINATTLRVELDPISRKR